MERLTFDGNFCDISLCQELAPCKYHDTGCSQKQVWERLKAYEDTGLEPEKVVILKQIVENAFSDKPEFVERLRELVKADKEGRVVVLPCKVGDTVYCISSYFDCEANAYSCCDEYLADENACDFCPKNVKILFVQEIKFKMEYTPMVGKSIFVIREEAEAALKVRGKNG